MSHVSQFYLIRTLGQGGFSHVYEVEDITTGERYAMKRCILKRYEQRVEFINEIQVARLVSGKQHALQYKFFKLTKGYIYFFMELCATSLDDILDSANELWPLVRSKNKLNSEDGSLSPASFQKLLASNKILLEQITPSDSSSSSSSSFEHSSDEDEDEDEDDDDEDEDEDDKRHTESNDNNNNSDRHSDGDASRSDADSRVHIVDREEYDSDNNDNDGGIIRKKSRHQSSSNNNNNNNPV